MAKLMGTTRTALSNWEKGLRKPDVLALARAQHDRRLAMPVEWVLLGLTRHVEFGDMAALTEACAEIGATMGGPEPEWPMAADARNAVTGAARAAAAVPRASARTLHERGGGFAEDQAPLDPPPRKTRHRGR